MSEQSVINLCFGVIGTLLMALGGALLWRLEHLTKAKHAHASKLTEHEARISVLEALREREDRHSQE